MSKTIETQLLVIGGGPGGYIAGIRAGQLGVKTVVVEGVNPGGTCLNIGCIPSKALIHAAEEFAKVAAFAAGTSPLGITVQAPTIDLAKTVEWKAGIVKKLTGGVGALLKKNGAQLIKGWATIVDGKTVDVAGAGENGGNLRIKCEHLLLATGSVPVELPFLPFGGKVISSTEALSPTALPKHLIVVGGGYIGLELGIVYRKLGCEVTVVEAQDRILPAYDNELTKPVATHLQKSGVKVLTGHSVLGLSESGALRVRDPDGTELSLDGDQILVAVGRRPKTDGFNLESLGLDLAGKAIKIDDQCRTSMRHVWAIGDVAGEPMLAHRAMAQGELVAEIVSGKTRRFVPAAIPAVCFTDPEVVVVGLSPDEANAQGIDAKTALFPFAANGRAMSLESTDGFVRVVARAGDHRIVGWQAVGVQVSELSIAFVQSIEMGATLEDIAGTIHPHPTLGEAVQEAALRALGHALHI
ncbi:dihydrolipoyl dehydrogenase [Luteimonas sp. S4-F44]|uniref:dihydrolipoyl dehydrogenase n=1 Tax=Luteimonas sp. S4-F44 TaxID=2925842 RepID=UPI001F534627|nr:dihydrolipoyl dehydrogenase [Luteimonas sp. S4-F44]UNK41027.1 dihydrolipoyl dehydrogenase [Luteimonas sp. S4-F44]